MTFPAKGSIAYLDILNQARDYVYITTPYLTLERSQEVTSDSLRNRRIRGWIVGAIVKIAAPLMCA